RPQLSYDWGLYGIMFDRLIHSGWLNFKSTALDRRLLSGKYRRVSMPTAEAGQLNPFEMQQ
ncbi:MAG: hypothetical protein V3T31_02050, partial [candidate division Zixibacteria bacterium]